MFLTLSAFAGVVPFLVPDYDRDGAINKSDYDRMAKGDAFTVWINDDDDAEGTDDGAEAGDYADTVVYGTIRTAEEGNPVAEAIAVKGGKYVYVGDTVGVSPIGE